MKNFKPAFRFSILAAALALNSVAQAHGVDAKPGNAKPAFDIVKTDIKIDTEKNWLTFSMHVSGKAGSVKPIKTGKFAGSQVFSYVWPTKIDPAEVGFDQGAGILALAVTAHPDFDDVPVFNIKGAEWHSHWVVLVPDETCGKGALKVKDIPEGAKPRLPKTWMISSLPAFTVFSTLADLTSSTGFTTASVFKGSTFTAGVSRPAE